MDTRYTLDPKGARGTQPAPYTGMTATDGRFVFKKESKLATLRAPQRKALDAFEAANRRGIVVLPCGVGKTALIWHTLCDLNPVKTLILTTNNSTALQLKRDLLENTTVSSGSVYLIISTEEKPIGFREEDKPAIVITTYTLFAESTKKKRSTETQDVFAEIRDVAWNFVCLDEVHVTPAASFKAFVTHVLKGKLEEERPSAILALTATLFREHRDKRGSDEDLTLEDFKFVGNVVYRESWADMQRQGIIAKLRFVRITCPLDPEVVEALDYTKSNTSNAKLGDVENDLYSLTPSKIEVAAALATFHNNCKGEQVLVFVEALVVLKVLENLNVFRNYIRLDGSSTPKERQDAFESIENETCPGLILTKIGDTGINFTSPRLSVVIKLNGPPRSRCRDAQRTGRVTRTVDVGGFPGETPEAAIARRRASQKNAVIYDLVTAGTSEEEGADYREQHLLIGEGYHLQNDGNKTETRDDEFSIIHETAARVVDVCNSHLSTPEERVKLSRNDRIDVVEAMAKRQEEAATYRATKAAHKKIDEHSRAKMKAATTWVESAPTPLFKEKRKKELDAKKLRIKRDAQKKKTEATLEVRAQMASAPQPPRLARP